MSNIATGLKNLASGIAAYGQIEYQREQDRLQREELRRLRQAEIQKLNAQNMWNDFTQNYYESYSDGYNNLVASDDNFNLEEDWKTKANERKNSILSTITDDYTREVVSATIDSWIINDNQKWADEYDSLVGARLTRSISSSVSQMMGEGNIQGAVQYLDERTNEGIITPADRETFLTEAISPAAKQELSRIALGLQDPSIYIYGGENVEALEAAKVEVLEAAKETDETDGEIANLDNRIRLSNKINSLMKLISPEDLDKEYNKLKGYISETRATVVRESKEWVEAYQIDLESMFENEQYTRIYDTLFSDETAMSYYRAGDSDGYAHQINRYNAKMREIDLANKAEQEKTAAEALEQELERSTEAYGLLREAMQNAHLDLVSSSKETGINKASELRRRIMDSPYWDMLTQDDKLDAFDEMNKVFDQYEKEAGRMMTDMVKAFVADGTLTKQQSMDFQKEYDNRVIRGEDPMPVMIDIGNRILSGSKANVLQDYEVSLATPEGQDTRAMNFSADNVRTGAESFLYDLYQGKIVTEEELNTNQYFITQITNDADRAINVLKNLGVVGRDENVSKEYIVRRDSESGSPRPFVMLTTESGQQIPIQPFVDSERDTMIIWRTPDAPGTDYDDSFAGVTWTDLSDHFGLKGSAVVGLGATYLNFISMDPSVQRRRQELLINNYDNQNDDYKRDFQAKVQAGIIPPKNLYAHIAISDWHKLDITQIQTAHELVAPNADRKFLDYLKSYGNVLSYILGGIQERNSLRDAYRRSGNSGSR